MSDDILTLIKDYAIAYNKAGEALEYFWELRFDEDGEDANFDLDKVIFRMCENNLPQNAVELAKDFGFDYEHIQQEGGGEGGSEYCYGVFKLNDKYFKAEYSYYSYNGYEYDYIVDTLKEVVPKEKTIIVYE